MRKLSRFACLMLAFLLSFALLHTGSVKATTALTGPVNLYTRDASSGTREGFEGVIGFKGELSDLANEVASNGDMAAKVGQDAQGIGYVSLTTDFDNNNIRPIAYEGVEATVQNTVSGDYKLARPFSFVTRASGDYESDAKEAIVAAFIAYISESSEGLEAIAAAGGIVDIDAGQPWDEVAAAHPITQEDNSHLELVTVGSTSVEKSVKMALETFQGLAGNVQFKMNHTGSGDGWKRVLGDEKDGANMGDIGFASRDFKSDSEPVDAGMASGVMCQDAIVVVVEAGNTAHENFSQDQVFALFTGAVTQWEDLSTAESTDASPINLYTRDASSGTREGFEGVIGFKGELSDMANEVASNGDMAAKVGQDPHGIGYVSLSTDFESNQIRPLAYEGVEATVANTVAGDYALARPFSFATRAAGNFDSESKEALVHAFLDYALRSTEGLEVIAAAGGIVDIDTGVPWSELAEDHAILAQDNSSVELVTVGSTSVEKVVKALLESFQPLAGNLQFKMNHTGSGDGWKRVLGDEKDGPNQGDIGFASREFKEDKEPLENAAIDGELCHDAIVIVVQEAQAYEGSLSQEQVYGIFTGAITDWNALETKGEDFVNAMDGPVNLYTRDASSGTREGFEGVIGFKGELSDLANEVASNGDMAAKVGQDPQGIGYVSLTTDFAANNLRPIKYEGVEATVANTVAGAYKLARPFCFTTRASGDYESDEQEAIVAAFVAFITESSEGLEAIAAAGGIVDIDAGRPWDELRLEHPIVDQDNSHLEIISVGSTSVEKAVKMALESFQGLAGNVQFKLNQTGSGDGWKRVLGDEKDGPNKGAIGFASRAFKSEDEALDAAFANGTMCQDAIVVVVEATSRLGDELSQDQVHALFTGSVSLWEDLK